MHMRSLVMYAGLLAAGPALAVDGVIEINHARALAGGVTPGDMPGYPVTISQSGSYRLTGNLTQPDADTDVISMGVGVNDVSIDLNGFSLQGSNVCTYNPTPLPGNVICTQHGSGIGVRGGGANNNVRNGAIRGMGGWGVVVDGGGVERISVTHSGGPGIRAGNVIHSSAKYNYGEGILLAATAATASVTNSEAEANGGTAGIRCFETACLIVNNVVSRNVLVGILTSEAVVTGNTANMNGSYGIDAQSSQVMGNTASRNGAEGLRAVSSGYSQNMLTGNKGTAAPGDQILDVSGFNLGGNVCASTLCP